MAFGAAVMVAAASALAEGLLGFLFGIPRALSSDTGSGTSKVGSRLVANTNLEQVSDWFTKIIVGATLVQLGSLTPRFAELAVSVSNIFGSPSMQAISRGLYARILADRGCHREAEELARSAAALFAQTEWLSLRADTLLELSHVLAAAGQVPEAHSAATEALELYQRKGNLPGDRESLRYLTQSAPA
jgi:hypothetical protein